MATSRYIDLGWTTIDLKAYSAICQNDDQPDKTRAREDFLVDLIFAYEALGRSLSTSKYLGRYRFRGNAYISDIEDAVRQGLILFDKIVVEVGHASGVAADSTFAERLYIDTVEAGYRFLDCDSLASLSDYFGHVLASDELAIAPSFFVHWEEPDFHTRGSNPHDVAFFLRPISEGWAALGRAESLSIQYSDHGEADGALNIPTLKGGSIANLIALRRDEREAFLRWREYLKGLSFDDPKSCRSAIEQGFGELRDRFQLLQRKGILAAIGTVAASAAAGITFQTGAEGSLAIGGLGMAAAAASEIKEILEQRHERERLRRDGGYFLWLVAMASTGRRSM